MKTHLPSVHKATDEDVPDERPVDKLYRIIRDASSQQRDESRMIRHLFLDQAAVQKAVDMATKKYFSHTSPSGVSANQNVRNTGYHLPDWYPLGGNNVESLYFGSNSPQDVAAAWLASDHHRPHVYGQNNFFRNQNCVGVGYAPVPGEENHGIWVFISAPCA